MSSDLLGHQKIQRERSYNLPIRSALAIVHTVLGTAGLIPRPRFFSDMDI